MVSFNFFKKKEKKEKKKEKTEEKKANKQSKKKTTKNKTIKKKTKQTKKKSTKQKSKKATKRKEQTKEKKEKKKEEIKLPKLKQEEIIVHKLTKTQFKELMENKWINTHIIIEILGAPKEHVEETLRNMVLLISKNSPEIMKLLNYELEKAEEVGKTADGKTTLYSAFAELDLMFNKPQTLTEFCFNYMPSSVEIIEPTNLELGNKELTNLYNDLQARLHSIDKIAKELRSENIYLHNKLKILERNAGLLLRNMILILLKEKQKTLKELALGTGIPENQLEPFLNKLINEGFLKKDKEKYIRLK